MAEIGDAYIDVHANTDPFDRELTSNLDRIADDSERELNRAGRQMGDDVSDGIGTQIRRRGKSFAKAVEDGTKNTVVRLRSTFRLDRVRNLFGRRAGRQLGDSMVEEVADAFERAGRRGGVFNKIGTTFADAIGAGFNVSGRSPLIAVLIPALFALVGLITALVQAINGLLPLLFSLPALFASIGLQVGVVAIAFQGMGEAIKGAFAAKNAKELDKALKDLTPSARSFVKELLPFRDLFKQIQTVTQENFFVQLAGAMTTLRQALGPTLVGGFANLAKVAGQFLRDFIQVLSSKGFVTFLNLLFRVTSEWVDKFGQSLFGRRGFIPALIAMSTALLPFLRKFGDIFVRFLDQISSLMFALSTNPDTNQWLFDMAATLQKVIDLVFMLGDFLFVFLKKLNEAGGQNIIESISIALQELIFFLSSPIGQKAMEGLVDLGIIGIRITTGLIIAILAVLAVLETAGEAINAFFHFLFDLLFQAREQGKKFSGAISNAMTAAGNRIKAIPGQIKAAFAGFGSLLINAGRSLIQGLIDGVRAKVGELFSLIASVASRIGGFFGSSPAEEGALSGKGWTMYRGQRMMQDLVEGIRSEIPVLREVVASATSNIVFGPGAVQVNVAGESPDVHRARIAGSAMGQSAASMIAARNTRLAVRTL